MNDRDYPISVKVSGQAKAALDRVNKKAKAATEGVDLGRRGRRDFKGALIDWIILHGLPVAEKKIDEGDVDFLAD